MEVKIGVQHAQRELVVETDETIENVEKLVADAVSSDGLLTLTDQKGRRTDHVRRDRRRRVRPGGLPLLTRHRTDRLPENREPAVRGPS